MYILIKLYLLFVILNQTCLIDVCCCRQHGLHTCRGRFVKGQSAPMEIVDLFFLATNLVNVVGVSAKHRDILR